MVVAVPQPKNRAWGIKVAHQNAGPRHLPPVKTNHLLRDVLLPWATGLLLLLFVLADERATDPAPVGVPIPDDPFELVYSCGPPPAWDRTHEWYQNVPPPPPPPLPPPPPRHREVYKVVEQMPLFPGCGELESSYERRRPCADQELLEFVYGRLERPSRHGARYSGTAVVSFVVEADGHPADYRLVRDPGHGLGAAALAAVRQMTTEGIRWEPGRLAGRAVPVQFNLPVKFDFR